MSYGRPLPKKPVFRFTPYGLLANFAGALAEGVDKVGVFGTGRVFVGNVAATGIIAEDSGTAIAHKITGRIVSVGSAADAGDAVAVGFRDVGGVGGSRVLAGAVAGSVVTVGIDEKAFR